MKNLEIKVNRNTSMVYLENTILGNDGENLQGDIIFSFVNDFVDGQARLEYEIEGEKRYLFLTKEDETYKTPIKSVLTKNGAINMQLVITEGVSEDEIPIFKSNVFYVFCNDSLNAEIEQPDEYPSWIEVANTKLNSIDEAIQKANNLDIEANKIENTTTINITKKDGSTKTVKIYDGEKGDKGDKGDAGSIKFIIVNELPTENIDETAIYMKASINPENQNTYEEFIYVDGIWETLGTAQVEVDLSDYIKNTDYATSSKAGLLRPANGLFTSGSTGALLISKASTAQIDAKTDNYYPIVPSNLEYAVKSVVGGHITLTQAEYDALTIKDENTFYYIVEG